MMLKFLATLSAILGAALYDRAYLDVNNTEAKSRSFKDILFGSKSGSNEIKSSSQGN